MEDSEPDAGDDLYLRCLAAAQASLDGLWTQDGPVKPGEPVVPPVTSHVNVYAEVYYFAFDKINLYYHLTGQGITTPMYRRQRRLCKAAARRAVASLFGEDVMRQAEREYDRLQESL